MGNPFCPLKKILVLNLGSVPSFDDLALDPSGYQTGWLMRVSSMATIDSEGASIYSGLLYIASAQDIRFDWSVLQLFYVNR